MRRWILAIGAMLALLTLILEADAFQGRFTVAEIRNYDPRDIRTFQLTASDGGAFIVMGDADLPLIKALGAWDGKKVSLDVDVFTNKELRR